jgi:hypothetical protein
MKLREKFKIILQDLRLLNLIKILIIKKNNTRMINFIILVCIMFVKTKIYIKNETYFFFFFF